MLDLAYVAFAQWRTWLLNLQQPATVQERELLNLVSKAQETRFGIEHQFASIKSVADDQARVPLRRYEEFFEEYWSKTFPVLENCTWPGTIPYFAMTSGTTTGQTKHIPLTYEMLQSNSNAIQDLLAFHLVARPLSRITHGKGLLLGGSTDLQELAPGIYCGDLSGIEANEVPNWAQPYVFPPRDLALLADWDAKIDRIARLSLHEVITAISGTPNWLLMFFDKLMELHPELDHRIVDVFPDLELIIHGGVDFKPYASRYRQLLAGSHAELREVYPASEAFIALADREPDRGLRLLVDNGVFFEFVPVGELESAKPTRHWLGTLQSNVDYAIVLSTCAGLWSYILGDTVKFVDLDPPRLVITGRITYWLSAFGEHLIDAEIEEAMAFAAESVGLNVRDFCVAPIYPTAAGETGKHLYIVEFAEGPLDASRCNRVSRLLDEKLQYLNTDYAQHRQGDYGLHPPIVRTVAKGRLAAWMRSRGMLGGQHKVPRVVNRPELLHNLLDFLAQPN